MPLRGEQTYRMIFRFSFVVVIQAFQSIEIDEEFFFFILPCLCLPISFSHFFLLLFDSFCLKHFSIMCKKKTLDWNAQITIQPTTVPIQITIQTWPNWKIADIREIVVQCFSSFHSPVRYFHWSYARICYFFHGSN